jgi:hypothetical protein
MGHYTGKISLDRLLPQMSVPYISQQVIKLEYFSLF